MLFLILAILSNCMVMLMIRCSEKNLHNRYAVTMFNYIAAVLISCFFIGNRPVWSGITEDQLFSLSLGIFNGILFIAWLFLFQGSIRYNGAPMSATFAKLGILLPTVGSMLIFAESPTLIQIIGVIIALAAIGLFYLPKVNRSEKVKKYSYPVLLLLILLIGGMADFDSKIFESFGDPNFDDLFLFYTFFTALILSIIIWLIKDRSVSRQDLYFGMLIGVPSQLTATFLLRAVIKLPAYFIFPVYSVGVILLISIISGLIFKEKLSYLQYFSMFLVCLALVCLTVNYAISMSENTLAIYY